MIVLKTVLSSVTSLLGSANARTLKSMAPLVREINRREHDTETLSDENIRDRIKTIRQEIGNGAPLNSFLTEVYAFVREAAKRQLAQRPFDVQLIGGIVLHQGKIAEMKTGEGKTLAATLPAALHALSGKGVHIVTVNDYLAKRDAEWMGMIYTSLGLSVGCIVPGLDDADRKHQYQADITYGTNNEFGFDYLRDNLKFRVQDMVQREFAYAIIDEVDSILIDEARTPLIISGASEDRTDIYTTINELVGQLAEDDFEKDEKQKTVVLTEDGSLKVEMLVKQYALLEGDSGLYEPQNIALLHHITQALKARQFFERDDQYIVHNGQIVIIDEFTGRMMEGRRYADGLHQAIEAKEGVRIRNENQTLASITFQNYFRQYAHLAGMTGTAQTEASEFSEIYGLDVVSIPTNQPMRREDCDDDIFRTSAERDAAVMKQIELCRKRKQPVLIGTVSIEKSEALSARLKKKNIPHRVLNARYHEKEAHIIADAGTSAAVTIATNMAGRGTDIQLGGNAQMRLDLYQNAHPKASKTALAKASAAIEQEVGKDKSQVVEAGGLFIIGTERHESRRIDNQLRGRSGRQGDPGASKFYISLEDDLMRIFGAKRMSSVLARLGIEEHEAISHPWVSKAIERAQRKIEEHHFEIRKQLLRFDDVVNDQRKAIFSQRRELMVMEKPMHLIRAFQDETIADYISQTIPEKAMPEEWDADNLHEEVRRLTSLDLDIASWAEEDGVDEREVEERIRIAVKKHTEQKKDTYGESLLQDVSRILMLQTLDQLWKDHLYQLDHLRQGIGLRAYGQRDPLNEYRSEAFLLFETMLRHFRETSLELFSRVQFAHIEDEGREAGHDFVLSAPQNMRQTHESHAPFSAAAWAEHGASPAETAGRIVSPVAGGPAGDGHAGDGHAGDSPVAGSAGAGSAAPRPEPSHPGTPQPAPSQTAVAAGQGAPAEWGRVPRNAPCPCGSGRKFKHCHGRVR